MENVCSGRGKWAKAFGDLIKRLFYGCFMTSNMTNLITKQPPNCLLIAVLSLINRLQNLSSENIAGHCNIYRKIGFLPKANYDGKRIQILLRVKRKIPWSLKFPYSDISYTFMQKEHKDSANNGQ